MTIIFLMIPESVPFLQLESAEIGILKMEYAIKCLDHAEDKKKKIVI